jgi:hypothetical protein
VWREGSAIVTKPLAALTLLDLFFLMIIAVGWLIACAVALHFNAKVWKLRQNADEQQDR